MPDEKSPKPFSPVLDEPAASPKPASQAQSTAPVQNVGIPGAAPLPPVQLKIHEYQYAPQELTLRPINIAPPAEDEDEDDDVGARPMFDAPDAAANWGLWIGALLLMLFFIAAAIWMMYKLPSN
jgi:hypothetical protein